MDVVCVMKANERKSPSCLGFGHCIFLRRFLAGVGIEVGVCIGWVVSDFFFSLLCILLK